MSKARDSRPTENRPKREYYATVRNVRLGPYASDVEAWAMVIRAYGDGLNPPAGTMVYPVIVA